MKRLLGSIFAFAFLGFLGFAAVFVLQNRSNLQTLVDLGLDYITGQEIDTDALRESAALSAQAAKEHASASTQAIKLPGFVKRKIASNLAKSEDMSPAMKVYLSDTLGIDHEQAGFSQTSLNQVRQSAAYKYLATGEESFDAGRYSERSITMPETKNPTSTYTTPQSILKQSEIIQAAGPVINAGIKHLRIIRPTAITTGPVPVVLLFHGAGRDAGSMLDMMSKAPSSRQFLLVSAQSKNDGWGGAVSDKTISHILGNLPKNIEIDTNRVFAFGHSAGAKYAGLLATVSNGALSGVAAHGGVFDFSTAQNLPKANFSEPMRIYIGADETVIPYEKAKPLATKFVERGHTVELVVIKNHGHWFFDRGYLLCEDALRWFTTLPLPSTLAQN